MDAYYRQITPGEYPLAFLMIDAKPSFVDVNVHPRKLEVKFADSRKVYEAIHTAVQTALGEKRISTVTPSFGTFHQSSVATSMVQENIFGG